LVRNNSTNIGGGGVVFDVEIYVSYAKAETSYIDPWNRELQNLIWFGSDSCFIVPILMEWGKIYYWDEPSQSRMFRNIFARRLSYMIHSIDTTGA
jgi:hypothetical protein